MSIAADFKDALASWASGVSIVSTRASGLVYGLTVSSFASLSLGPPMATVPNVVGLTAEQARALLRSAGLSVGRYEGNPQRTILTQNPPAGAQIPVGRGISVVFVP